MGIVQLRYFLFQRRIDWDQLGLGNSRQDFIVDQRKIPLPLIKHHGEQIPDLWFVFKDRLFCNFQNATLDRYPVAPMISFKSPSSALCASTSEFKCVILAVESSNIIRLSNRKGSTKYKGGGKMSARNSLIKASEASSADV